MIEVFSMPLKYYLFIALVAGLSCAAAQAKDQKPALCPTENPCRDLNNSCTCYCSRECGPRDKKKEEDEPVFVPDDPHGHYCYCKQWDKDEFENRCKTQDKTQEKKQEENKESKK